LNANVRILSVIIVFLLVSAIVSKSIAQEDSSLEPKAKTVLFAITKLNQTATASLNRLSLLGSSSISEAVEQYGTANSMAQQAFVHLKNGEYSSAYANALEAMKAYQGVLKITEAAFVAIAEPTLAAERIINLKAAVNRTYAYLERISNLSANAKAEGFNVTAIEKTINETRLCLDLGLKQISSLDLNGAIQSLSSAKTLLDQLMSLQNDLSRQMVLHRTTEYVARAEERVEALRNEISSVAANVPTPVQAASLSALNQAEVSLHTANTYLGMGKITEGITQLQNYRSQELRSINILKAAGVNVTSQPSNADLGSTSSSVVPSNTGISPSNAGSTTVWGSP
jgi:hypothetical protein